MSIHDLREKDDLEERKASEIIGVGEKGVPDLAVDKAKQIKREGLVTTPYHINANINKDALNIDKITQKAAQSQKDKSEGKQADVSDQFFEAVSFFMPTVIGGLVGSAIGGSEGAVKGATYGQSAADKYRTYQTAKQTRQDRLNKQSQDRISKVKAAGIKAQGGKDLSKISVNSKFKDINTGKNLFEISDSEGNVSFKDSDNNVVKDTGKNILRHEDIISYRKQDRIDRRQLANFSERDNKNILANKNTFVGDRIKLERNGLQQIDKLDTLLKSNTKIVGLIDFAMAKGIALEVGNLAEGERKAAASMIGFSGMWSGVKEFVTSKLSGMRRSEIRNLINHIRPSLRKKIQTKAKLHARSASRRLKVQEDDYARELLDETGLVFEEKESRKDKLARLRFNKKGRK